MTRSERNHNPLNIRRSARTRWRGQCEVQDDKEFVQFNNDLMGYRAAFRVLRTYMEGYGIGTVAGIVRRWAPPEDGNLTSAYIDLVRRFSGLNPELPIRWGEREKMVALVRAMARVEGGSCRVGDETLALAYEMAGPAGRK